MADYAIGRNGELVREVKFIGEGLYRDKEVVVALFKTEKAAKEVADVLNGTPVLYEEYIRLYEVSLAA